MCLEVVSGKCSEFLQVMVPLAADIASSLGEVP